MACSRASIAREPQPFNTQDARNSGAVLVLENAEVLLMEHAESVCAAARACVGCCAPTA